MELSGKRSSITRHIAAVSQKMSAPTCKTGVFRYPPVKAIRSGFGMITGISTI